MPWRLIVLRNALAFVCVMPRRLVVCVMPLAFNRFAAMPWRFDRLA
jgi:hypothetical protein